MKWRVYSIILIHVHTHIPNGLVLICDQGLGKLHLLLLKPPLPLRPPCPPTPKPWGLQICFLCLQFWFHGVSQIWHGTVCGCFAWLLFLGAMFLRLICVTFHFKNIILSVVQTDFQGSQCESLKVLEH